MSVQVGFGSPSQTSPITYFDVSVPTNGTKHKVSSLKATNKDKGTITVPTDYAVNLVQLATVPNGVQVTVHFESENITLNGTTEKVNLPGPGLALGNATVSASIKN